MSEERRIVECDHAMTGVPIYRVTLVRESTVEPSSSPVRNQPRLQTSCARSSPAGSRAVRRSACSTRSTGR